MIHRFLLAASAALVLAACGDGGGGGDDDTGGGTGPVVPPVLSVSVATTGRPLDRDGYTLRLAGDSVGHVGVNGTFTVPNPRAGTSALVLDGVRHNCTVEGGSSRTVELRSGATVNLSLQVVCAPTDIAFLARQNVTGPYGLFVRRGSGEPQLLATPVNPSRVTWSPDGHRIAYTVSVGFVGGTDVWYIDVDSMKRVRVPAPGPATHPDWSPDGQRLAVMMPGSEGSDIWTLRLDGGNAVNITDAAGARELMPAWSPDGSRIAYLRPSGFELQEIWTVNPDGSDPRRVTELAGLAYNTIAWTRDGRRIVFSPVVQPSGWQIFSVNADGSDRVQLTNELPSFHPATLSDGRIGFVRNGEVYTMKADGTDVRNVSNTTAYYEMAVAWQ